MLSLRSLVAESEPHNINHMAVCRPITEGSIRALIKGVIRMFNKSLGIYISSQYRISCLVACFEGTVVHRSARN